MKVVINNCFGGFSLSPAAIERYAQIKGIALYPEPGKYGDVTYWTIPQESRPSPQDRKAYNEAYSKSVLYDRDIPRDDPALVQVVEEMGQRADGGCASLKVVSIPDGVPYEIAEYDGNEHIAETHRTWS